VDSATGLCVQGGAPLIGDRGMLTDALCLWKAAALSASGVVSVSTATGQGGSPMVSCTGHEVSALTAEPENRVAGRQDQCQAAHTSSVRSLPHDASVRNGIESLSMHATSLGVPGHAMRPIRSHFRSLSYLSLTLWCTAPHSGWLGGCAPPQMSEGERKMAAPSIRSDGQTGENRPPGHRAHAPSKEGIGPRPVAGLTSRMRPVFL